MARVLVIDDELIVRVTIEKVLTRDGHTVQLANDGLEALAACKADRFDLAISDIVMPRMEGVEAIIELRKLAPSMPVIAMSGGGRVGNFDFLELAQRVGADQVLRKPFFPDDLRSVVAEALINSDAIVDESQAIG